MQIQQRIELEAAHQRNASSILSSLAARRERLTRRRRPERARRRAARNLRCSWSKKASLEELPCCLEEAQEQQPKLEAERRAAQERCSKESADPMAPAGSAPVGPQAVAGKRPDQGKVQPWLEKHELGNLPRLWQKLHIEAGWETALESVLRERHVGAGSVEPGLGARPSSPTRRRPSWRCTHRIRCRQPSNRRRSWAETFVACCNSTTRACAR
jgi:chromosome segregation protein